MHYIYHVTINSQHIMKHLLFILTAIALMMVYSCSHKESTLVEERFEDVPLTVKATMADKSDSKTVLEDGNVLWTSGDAINLFFSNQSSGQFTTNIDTPSATAEFTGTLSVATGSAEIGTTGKAFWAVYPFNQNNTCDGSSVTLTVPSVQSSLAGSFADKLNPSVATSPGLDLAFYNVCAPFYFSVTQSGVTSATFSGNNNEDVAGQVRVTMDSNGLPVAEVVSGQGAKSITINAPDGGFVPGTTYVLVLLPQTLTSGYSLILKKGNAATRCVVSKNAEFIRSQGRSKMDVDDGMIYVSEIEAHEAIDIGLSAKWSSCNLGTYWPDEYGHYYAWGEIGTKEDYSWETYKWCNGHYNDLTKYCTSSWYGTVDHKSILDLEDDVAHDELGGSWRMPTSSEVSELIATRNNSSYEWEWKSLNGHNGWQITYLVNNQRIFLPAAGRRDGTSLEFDDTGGFYWYTSVYTYTGESDKAWFVCFMNTGMGVAAVSRCRGQTVRPVKNKGLEDEIITDGAFTGDANSLSMTTASGITISQLKNSGNNCNTSFNTVSTLRVYKNNRIQFSGKTFKSIEMYYTGSYSGSDWTIIDGGGTIEIDTTNKKVVWENPDGASVVTLQNSGTSKNVQLRTTEFVITYE